MVLRSSLERRSKVLRTRPHLQLAAPPPTSCGAHAGALATPGAGRAIPTQLAASTPDDPARPTHLIAARAGESPQPARRPC